MAHMHHKGGKPAHAAKHDKIMSHLDDNDHLTKKGGGEPTHGSEANFKVSEKSEKDKTPGAGTLDKVLGGPSGTYQKGR